MAKRKNPAAVALGKLGGKKGGRARMASMTPEERSQFASMGGKTGGKKRLKTLTAAERREIARKAGLASAAKRWGKKK